MESDLIKALSCDGVAPSGPVSAWPKSRNEALQKMAIVQAPGEAVHGEDPTVNMDKRATKVEVSNVKMMQNAAEAAKIAFTKGKVSKEIYDERYATCQTCPAFIEKSNRCSKCGCFMKAKAWLNAKPEKLCPLRKWER